MENFGIIVKSLEDLNLIESPSMYFFDGLFNSHNHIWVISLEDIDKVLLGYKGFLVFIGITLLKLLELPIVLLSRLTPKHEIK